MFINQMPRLCDGVFKVFQINFRFGRFFVTLGILNNFLPTDSGIPTDSEHFDRESRAHRVAEIPDRGYGSACPGQIRIARTRTIVFCKGSCEDSGESQNHARRV